ncbi:MAG: succinate dehydrogenase/fumarate reductase flavoprotein subunit, partial [Betaproteobacteria bacterium]
FSLPARNLSPLRERLFDLMWDEVGILRTKTSIERGLAGLGQLRDELRSTGVADGNRNFNLTWHDWLNLDSLLRVSEAIATAALAREDSRGAHFREDHPETGALEGSQYTRVQQDGGELRLSFAPVQFTRVQPGQSLLAE